MEPIKIAIIEQDKYYDNLKIDFFKNIEIVKKDFSSYEDFQPYYENHFYLYDVTLLKLKQYNFNSLVLLIFTNLENLLKTIIEEEFKNIKLKQVKSDFIENYLKIIAIELKIDNYNNLESYKFISNYKKLRNIIVHNNSILIDKKYIDLFNKNEYLNLIPLEKKNQTSIYKVQIIESKFIHQLISNSIKLIEDIFKIT